MKKIAVVGATGFTGRLTCEKLLEAAGSRGEIRVVLGGRDRRELERLSLDLGKRFKQAVDVLVFDFADRPSLRILCDNSAVVVNCAAPYSVSGPPVLASCVHAKAHLVDASNETGYIEQCSLRSTVVKEAGVAVVNGLAIDPGVADLAVEVAVRGWEPVNSVDVLYTTKDVEETNGMRASLLETLKQPCRIYADRSLQPAKVAGKKREFRWSGGGAKGKLMPGGEVFVLPRHLPGVRNVAAYRMLEGKQGMLVSLLSSPLASVGMMMMQKWAREAKDGVPPTRDPSQFAVILEIEGIKNRRLAVVQGQGLHTTTAAMLAHAALKLANDAPRMTGVVSPAQAFDAKWLLEVAGLEVQVADGVIV